MTSEANDVTAAAPTVRIGISSCLLGQKVRFDGGHKRDAFLVDTFGRFVEWLPVCPEVEAGMGLPREPIRLLRTGSGIRLVGVRTATDHTDAMARFTEIGKLPLERFHHRTADKSGIAESLFHHIK